MINGDDLNSEPIILSRKDELYKKIDSLNTLANYSIRFEEIPRLAKVDGETYTYSYFLDHNENESFWGYVATFNVDGELCISDPCYLDNDTGTLSYLNNCKDKFYAFCCMKGGYMTDVLVLNHKIMNDSKNETIDLDIKDFIDVKRLGVDSGCITFCDKQPFMGKQSKEFSSWYEKEVISRWYDKSYSMVKEDGIDPYGIVVSSGFGDGYYELKQYENKEGGHVAYYINFVEPGESDDADGITLIDMEG
jgi:hypothetical protein